MAADVVCAGSILANAPLENQTFEQLTQILLCLLGELQNNIVIGEDFGEEVSAKIIDKQFLLLKTTSKNAIIKGVYRHP